MTDETNPKPDANEKPEAADGGDPAAPTRGCRRQGGRRVPAAAKAEATEAAAVKASAKADPPDDEELAKETAAMSSIRSASKAEVADLMTARRGRRDGEPAPAAERRWLMRAFTPSPARARASRGRRQSQPRPRRRLGRHEEG
jgi:hypothetical protein